MNKMYRSIWNSASGTYVAAPESSKSKGRRAGAVVVAAGAVAAALASGSASAQVVSACTGVSLPQSVVTDIVGQAVVPLAGTLDTVLGPITGLLGLQTNLESTLAGIAAGQPIRLNVLDTNGNVVNPAAPCPTTADSYELTNPKGISIGGNKITGLGDGTAGNEADAGEINSIAFGNRAKTDATAANSIAIGPDATVGANATNSVALGSLANASAANSVALGAGSTATVGAQTNYTAYGLTAPQTSVGEVSVGSAGNTRQITNVAAGSAATDAVNVAQLQAVDNGAVKYDDPTLKTSVTLGGVGATTPVALKNVAAGSAPTDAVNVSQLQTVQGNTDNLAAKFALALGGGASYDAATGTWTGPTYAVYGQNFNNVGGAILALQTSAPIQYSNTSGVATPGAPSNDVTLVGAAPGPVTVHNVATPTSGTDAANKNYVDNAVSQGTANAVQYDGPAKDKVTLAGPTSTDGGQTGGTTITNVHQGQLSPTSTDAVNGSQLYATNQRIDNIENGGGIKYFHANSTKADSSATGTDATAMGPAATASGDSSVAAGDGALASGANSVAMGKNAQATGPNTVAIGNGAVARNSVAVGSGAQADNGGAAFGDNAVAMTAQQGTAIGNGATVTADRGVALGAGSQATRAGMNGTTEKYSNVAVASNQGAVSVGSAGNERQITNVAGGTAPTDAVNVRQLDAAVAQANQYTDSRIYGLQTDINDLRKDANAGSASAMAMASMPQSAMPGRTLVAAGTSYYQGQSALSLGISTLSDNGRWVAKFGGTTNTRGNVGAGAGLGYYW